MAPRRRYPVAIIGPGALGTLFSRRLSKFTPNALIGRNTAPLPEADWVIVLVKAYDTAAAVRTARRMRPKGVLSLQNGLVQEVPQGVTTAAAYRDGARVVEVTTGKTLLPLGFEALARLLRGAGFDARVTRDIGRARLAKLLANACLNPVTAIFRIRNGALREVPYAFFARALAREAAPVLAAEGLRITPEAAERRVLEVATATAGNRSSMLQDVLAGRRTEIDYITGALRRLARGRGLAVPTHATFHHLVRLLERSAMQ